MSQSAHLKGAAQRCIRSLEEAASMMRDAFRATSRGTHESQTHTILTLTVGASGMFEARPTPKARPAKVAHAKMTDSDLAAMSEFFLPRIAVRRPWAHGRLKASQRAQRSWYK